MSPHGAQVHLDLVKPEKIAADVRRKTMRKVVNIVARKARTLAPVGDRTIASRVYKGRKKKSRKRLKATIQGRVLNGGMEGAVVAMSRHAHLVIAGTRAHIIRAKYHHVLAVGGHIIAGKGVRHPGSRPNDFLTRAAEASRADVQTELRNSV